jgi:uncharacterized C2H2 Zn-finger protein
MLESKASNHVIICDNCGELFRYQEPYMEHRKKGCQHPKVTTDRLPPV